MKFKSLLTPAAFALPASLGLLLSGCADSSPDAGVWTNTATVSAGEKFPKLHGFFNAEPVSVTLRDLPEHRWMKVRFKLLTFGTWDGSNRAWGPDLWSLQVRGGPQLWLTSFSNMRPKSPWYVQAFPDDFPYGVHDAFTGAGPLGRPEFPRGDGETDGIFANALYPVEVVFPHWGSSLTPDFNGIYNDPPEEKQDWGIAGPEYETAADPVALEEVELFRLWDEPASRDAVRANAALWRFVSGGDKSVAFIAARVRALADADSGTPGLSPVYAALRVKRAEKVLRIVDSAGSRGTREAITRLSPEYNGSPERRN